MPTGSHVNSPSWSPDGKVAWIQFFANKSTLMVAGKQVGVSDDVFLFPATWLSSDRILYTANGNIRISTVAAGATEDIPFQASFTLNRPALHKEEIRFSISTSSQARESCIVSPALSPDGKRIVFEALNQLWLMEIGGKPFALTNDKFYKEDPAWSPDGKSIAYSSDKGGTEDIYVLDVATKQEKRTLRTQPMRPRYRRPGRPDGKMLACQDQDGATYTLDLASGAKKQVIAAQFAPSKPSWSANGSTIAIAALKAYTHRFREGTSQILTVDLPSGKLTYTEPAAWKSIGTRGEDGPLYSPDGSFIAFVMDSVLWIRPVDKNGIPTGVARAINHEVTDAPTWSGDSKKLLYLSNGKSQHQVDGTNAATVPLDLTWQYEKSAGTTIIHAGRLWDGRGADVKTDVDIVVAGDRIQSIEPHRQRAASANTKLVDAANLTVIPGLWESHTHEYISGKFYGDRLGRLWLAYGVTELHSMGDPVYRSAETTEAFGSGDRIGPRFFGVGEASTRSARSITTSCDPS